MENCSPTVVSLRHREALAQAEASRLLASLPPGPSLRARLASILVTLAVPRPGECSPPAGAGGASRGHLGVTLRVRGRCRVAAHDDKRRQQGARQ